MRIEDFVGLEVLTGDAMVIGHVEGVGIDVATWKIPALKVGLKKGVEDEMGLKKPMFGSTNVCIRADGVDSISDTITLTKELKALPEIIMEEKEEELPTAGSLVSTRVIAKGGRQLGYVDNFIFAPEREWAVTCMVVKLEKSVLADLGMKKPRLGTPSIKILSDDIKTIGDMVLLKIDIKELRDHLEKKPRKKTQEEFEDSEEPPERISSPEDDDDKLPFNVNPGFNNDGDGSRRYENL
jgi:sporulation protein YlmC with PRC-barrel domain